MMDDIVRSPRKHYSPLRYPGGKSCLSEFLSYVIKKNSIPNCKYVEPFAGGAGAALTLLFLEKVDSIVINDLDKSIYSLWYSILNHTDEFVEKILQSEVTIDEWHDQKIIYKSKTDNVLELGYSTFFLNRTNRSGIIEGGPIGGMSQAGKWLINARFTKSELIKRIKAISSYKSRIELTNMDGIDLLSEIKTDKNLFVYLDPPYYVKGNCLYLNHYNNDNHASLANYLNIEKDFKWALTYDNVKEIKNLYEKRRVYDFNLNYHIDLPKLGKEVLVVSDNLLI